MPTNLERPNSRAHDAKPDVSFHTQRTAWAKFRKQNSILRSMTAVSHSHPVMSSIASPVCLDGKSYT